MLRFRGRLVIEGDRIEAWGAVADFTGRMRALGHDVDEVEIEIVANDRPAPKHPAPYIAAVAREAVAEHERRMHGKRSDG